MTNPEKPPERCPTRLITDHVADEDAFRHQEIAKAIADMILNEDGGAIALTGAWGSGKSTVVKFLQAELTAANGDTGIFVFDAWAHQGDPLRRTFLEKLIGWCNDQNPSWTKDPDKWNNTIEELARRRETTTSKVSPNLTVWGAVGAISLLLVPLATQMYLKNSYADHRGWDLTGLFFSVLPALIASLLLVWWLPIESRKEKDRRPLPSFLSTGTENTTTSDTSRTADPTSVEFEKHYRNLLDEAMKGNSRRLVIVVDNLDRVAHDDARSIWATLRVFFDPSIDGSANWRNRVWVLVPFDPEAIDDLWEVPQDGSSPRPGMSRHFLEKTFQATFRVPPIILTRWEDFLVRQLRTAFPSKSHTEDEFHTIFRLYDQLKPADDAAPTPRNLKLFVNKVGALHRQWQGSIPLKHQAAFALISDETPETILAILRGEVAPPRAPDKINKLSGLLGDGWRLNLAALFFNLRPDDGAAEALLSTPIEKALSEGSPEALSTLETIPGFSAVLEGIVENTCIGGQTNPEQLALLATAFAGANWTDPRYALCRNQIYGAAKKVKLWQPINEATGRGIGCIAKIAPDGCDLSPIIKSIRDSFAAQANQKEWCEAIAQALPPFIARNEGAVKEHFRVQATAEQFLQIVAQAGASGKFVELLKYMQPSAERGEIVNLLANQAATGKWDDAGRKTVERLRQIDDSWDWKPLITQLPGRLSVDSQTLQPDVPAALNTLFDLSAQIQEVRTAIQNTAQGDSLFAQFYHLTQAGNQAAAAICAVALLSSGTQLQPAQPQQPLHPRSQQWRINQGKQLLWNCLQRPESNEPLLKTLSGICTPWLTLGEWRQKVQAKQERANLIGQMLKRRLQMADPPKLTAKELIENTDYWAKVTDQDTINALLSQEAASGDLESALSEASFSPKQSDLYLRALEGSGSDKYRSFLSEGLRGLSTDDWLKALKDESASVEVALRLSADGLRLGQPLQDALEAHVKLKLSNDSVGRLAPRWQELIGLLEQNDLNVFAQRLLSHFNSGVDRIKGLLPYYGPLLTKVVKRDDPSRSIQRVIQITEAHDAAEVAWLTNVIEAWPKGSMEEIRADLRSRAEKSVNDEKLTEEQKGALSALIGALSQGG